MTTESRVAWEVESEKPEREEMFLNKRTNPHVQRRSESGMRNCNPSTPSG